MVWLRRVRANRWLHFTLLPLAGVDFREGFISAAGATLRGCVVAVTVLAFGYLLNGISDRGMDGPTKSAFPSKSACDSSCIAAALLASVALTVAASASSRVFFATLVCVVSGVVYSVGPRIKRLPFLGTLTNLTNFVPLLWVGEVGAGHYPMVPLAAALSCMLLQNQLLHEAADRLEDVRGGLRTTFVWLGPRRAAVLSMLLGGGVMITASREMPGGWLLGIPYLLVFPGALLFAGGDVALMARVRVIHRLVALATGAVLFGFFRLRP